jgi:ORF6N domain
MSKEIIPIERIARAILLLRGEKVMLDSDLAALYDVAAGQLNRAVKRNRSRFPSDFMFELTAEEVANLKCQIGISSWGGRRRARPHAFTERVGKHDHEIAAILEAIRQLMVPPEKPRREIGFHVRERRPRYRLRKRA